MEKHIVPIVTSLRDFNGNNMFTKVTIWYLDPAKYSVIFPLQDDIHLAAGVLDTNCFEIKTKDKVSRTGSEEALIKAIIWIFIPPILNVVFAQFGRSLFLNAAMLNNNCSPNCVRRVTEGRIDIISVR